jgi:hypothetical protein
MIKLNKSTPSLTCPHCDQSLERSADSVYESEKPACKCKPINDCKDDSMDREIAIIEGKLDKLSALHEKIFRDLKTH